MAEGEKGIDKVETLRVGGVVGGGEFHTLLVAGVVMVTKKCHDGEERGGSYMQRELVLVDTCAFDIFWKTLHQILAILNGFGYGLRHVDKRINFV